MSEKPRNCNLVVNFESSEILISGLSSEDLTIEYRNDIDLTELVMGFAKLIDKGESVVLEMPTDVDDEKVALILATIKDIADAYNASLKSNKASAADESVASDEDDIPF